MIRQQTTAGIIPGMGIMARIIPSILWNATGGYDDKGAYMLDGLNGYIDVGSNESFDMVSGKITISAWIKTTPSGTYPNYCK